MMNGHEYDGSSGRRRPFNSGRPSTGGSHDHGHNILAPMAIPGSQMAPIAPPPLPPPRHVDVDQYAPHPEHIDVDEYAAGSGRQWGWESDSRGGGTFGKPRGPSSALESFPKSWGRSLDEGRPSTEQPDYRRRQSANDPARSPTSSKYDPSSRLDEGYYSLSVGPNSGNQQLHGERHLHHRGQEKTSQAYDNKLLSKLGKPKTPPRTGSFASSENSPTSILTFGRQLPPQPRSLSFPNSITSGYSDSPIKREPGSRFDESPRSRPVSPGTLSGGKGFTDYRSPTLSTRSSTLESTSDTYSPFQQRFPLSPNDGPRQQKSRRSIGSSLLSNVDESAAAGSAFKIQTSLPTRPVKRESYDHSIFSEPDSALSVDQLHIEDRPTATAHRDPTYRYNPAPSHQLHSSHSMSGIRKRKQGQMASPADASHDGALSLQQVASTATQFGQNNAPAHLSPNQYASQHQGSISSQSSTGFRNGSYASSGGPSVGGSSYTSLDQPSPGGVSPSEQQQQYQQHMAQEAQYNQALSLDPTHRAGPYPDPPQQQFDTTQDTKPPPPTKQARTSNAPDLSTNTLLCECCLKKPRKFATVEEKIQHELEKQYRCLYCTNRFKNKNEAERHQNSLHLRRHSWSCAVLAANYTAAFFPTSELPTPQTIPGQPEPTITAYDTCGYCGLEFANEPAPDWDERTRHLDDVHKFRECNQSKKFFRADHFRQHLKHSHAGTSGKWTNRLEQACIKEEPPAIPLDQQQQQQNNNNTSSTENTPTQSAPVANMGNMTTQQQQQDLANHHHHHQQQHSPLSHHQNGPHLNVTMPQQQQQQQQQNSSPPGVGYMPQQNLAQHMDMSNIDPSISMQQLGAMANMGAMAPPPRGGQGQVQGQGIYEDMKAEGGGGL